MPEFTEPETNTELPAELEPDGNAAPVAEVPVIQPAARSTTPQPLAEPPAVPPVTPQWWAGEPILLIGLAALVIVVLGRIVLWRRNSARADAAPTMPKAFLNDIARITARASYELTNRYTVIGRIEGPKLADTSYVVIKESTIGRRHAMIEFREQSFWVIDQGSLNGTFVGGKRIESATLLKHGDRIRVHKSEFEFLIMDMFETDRTMMSETVFAELSAELEKQNATTK